MAKLTSGDCPVCMGTGNSPRLVGQPCKHCYGTGWFLSNKGEEVAQLIERMLDARQKREVEHD